MLCKITTIYSYIINHYGSFKKSKYILTFGGIYIFYSNFILWVSFVAKIHSYRTAKSLSGSSSLTHNHPERFEY